MCDVRGRYDCFSVANLDDKLKHVGHLERGANKMSDRKYNQRGYMQNDRESQGPKSQSKAQSKPLSKHEHREGPSSPRMMAFAEASKCTACGAKAPPNINVDSSCPKCNADLHSCRQCTHFDPGARFECNKSIPARMEQTRAQHVRTVRGSNRSRARNFVRPADGCS